MLNLSEVAANLTRGLKDAVVRFPLTVIALALAAGLNCYLIYLDSPAESGVVKLLYAALIMALTGMAGQFLFESMAQGTRMRLLFYGLALAAAAGFYALIAPAPNIFFDPPVKTAAAALAVYCAALWAPSYRNQFDVNRTALIHLKAGFVAVMFSIVLSIGCMAIIAAVDTLLSPIDEKAYPYTLTAVWFLFAPLFYLSLLPRFNSLEPGDLEYKEEAGQCPQALAVLISHIAIPLTAVFTLVLLAYFVKILVTMRWPSGQVGPMVLAYSGAGLMIYVLASLLQNRSCDLYVKTFPKVLIPIVIMQLVSVIIRLQAYGFTESRYYVLLFGIFALTSAILLSVVQTKGTGIVVLLAALFALVSIIPPIDAFTVSRVSQINRLEKMLAAERVLVNGKLQPHSGVSNELKKEVTSIMDYLWLHRYTQFVKWLPADFDMSEKQFTRVMGFKPYYVPADTPDKYLSAVLDGQLPLAVGGYDIMLVESSNSQENIEDYDPASEVGKQQVSNFNVNGQNFELRLKRLSAREVRVSVHDASGAEILGTGLYEKARLIAEKGEKSERTDFSPEEMGFDISKNGYRMRIVFQNIFIHYPENREPKADYSFYVFFDAP